jgi:hypothetical protein
MKGGMRERPLTLLAGVTALLGACAQEEEPVANKFERQKAEIENKARAYEAQAENEVGAIEAELDNQVDALLRNQLGNASEVNTVESDER